MANALKELQNKLKEINKTIDNIIALNIAKYECCEYYNPDIRIKATKENIKEKIKELDFDYCEGYGSQELYGLVLFDDNSWLERGEYDGSEWWEYKKPPTIEEVLNDKIIAP